MNTAYRVSSTLDATARPASWGVPRWPTTAVSASTYSGSAMRAPSAGAARAAISRSCGLRSRRRKAVVGSFMSRSADQSAVAYIDRWSMDNSRGGTRKAVSRLAGGRRAGRTLLPMSDRPSGVTGKHGESERGQGGPAEGQERGARRESTSSSETIVDVKPRSREVTDGFERAPARAMLRAIGMTDDDWDKPQVGVCSSWNEVTPCNLPLDRLAKRSKAGVRAAGGFPIEFTTIAVSDGISMGHEGMRASLVSREVIADSVETVMHAERLDALVTFAGCDKSLPGMLMAAARLNVPSVFLYGGSILPGVGPRGEALDIVSVFEAVGAEAAGTIDA